MSQAINVQSALELYAEIFELAVEDISPATKRSDIEGWDSLGVLTLMAEYDSRFGIIFAPGEMESCQSLNDLIDVLRKHNKILES